MPIGQLMVQVTSVDQVCCWSADRVITFLLEEGLLRLTEYPDPILGRVLMLVMINVHGGIERLLKGRDPWLERYCEPRA